MRIFMAVAFFMVFQLSGVPALAEPPRLTLERPGVADQVMDLSDLDEMPQLRFTTGTIWTDEPVTFSGVPLRDIVGEIPAGWGLRLVALNDYQVDLPLDGIGDDAPIVATRMNGREISVRDKGPYWIVYPYDSDSAYQNETIYARSVWQLSIIRIVDGS